MLLVTDFAADFPTGAASFTSLRESNLSSSASLDPNHRREKQTMHAPEPPNAGKFVFVFQCGMRARRSVMVAGVWK